MLADILKGICKKGISIIPAKYGPDCIINAGHFTYLAELQESDIIITGPGIGGPVPRKVVPLADPDLVSVINNVLRKSRKRAQAECRASKRKCNKNKF